MHVRKCFISQLCAFIKFSTLANNFFPPGDLQFTPNKQGYILLALSYIAQLKLVVGRKTLLPIVVYM